MPINSFLYPGPTNSNPYVVDNSCRFNRADSAYMHKTPGGAGSTKIFTFSAWVKRASIGSNQLIFNAGEGDTTDDWLFYFHSGDQIKIFDFSNGGATTNIAVVTNQVFRDVSAWYHLVLAVDTSQGTAANRVKLYVNGTQVTSLETATYPSQDFVIDVNSTDAHWIGRRGDNNDYFDGYMAEVCMIDGTQYAASDFGEFDEDSPTIWKPKDVSGLTFGTNGFYLDFEDSANLGNDANGGTDLTEVNLAAADQATDTPTNNFATMNPLDNSASAATFSEGNLKLAYSGSNGSGVGLTSTFALTKGKWYFEAKLQASNDTGNSFGITDINAQSNAAANRLGVSTYSYVINDSDGKIYNNNDSGTSYGSALDVGDIIGVYLDLDNNKLYFSEDGTLGSSTGHSITAASSVSNGHYFFAVGLNSGSGTSTFECNFGGCPAFSISSGNTDDNGYGNFEYSPNITGDSEAKKFYALCTKNLAEYG